MNWKNAMLKCMSFLHQCTFSKIVLYIICNVAYKLFIVRVIQPLLAFLSLCSVHVSYVCRMHNI